MKVGVIAEASGIVRDSFARRGHDAVSCDIRFSARPGPHRRGRAQDFDWNGFDLLICHPPCTYLCNSGVRWLFNRDGTINARRWVKMLEAVEFFQWCLQLPCERIGIEQPIMHKHAAERLAPWVPSQTIQPWQFGHGETKATQFWLKGLPPLVPTNIVSGREQRIHKMARGPLRGMKRSITYQGIADAMAEQWG